MISAILVNDAPLGIRNPSTIEVTIEGITSEAERSESGDIAVLNKVNSIPKLTLSWEFLYVDELEQLCSLFNIGVAPYGGTYTPKDINELTYKITARLPSGIASFTSYVGDTLKATLHDHSEEPDANIIGGQYWTNISITFVGTGENWKI